MDGLYAQTLREQIARGTLSLEKALKFLLDHHVHPRIAMRLLAEGEDSRSLIKAQALAATVIAEVSR